MRVARVNLIQFVFSSFYVWKATHTHEPDKKKKIEAATKYCRSLLLIFSGWYSRFGCCCFRISWFWFDAVSVVLCHQSAAVLLLSLYKICMCARLIMNDNNKIVWFALKLKWILTSFWQMNRTRDVWLLALRVFISFDIENLTHTGTHTRSLQPVDCTISNETVLHLIANCSACVVKPAETNRWHPRICVR